MISITANYIILVIILTLSIFSKCNSDNIDNTNLVDIGQQEDNRILQVFNSKQTYERPDLQSLSNISGNAKNPDSNNLDKPLGESNNDIEKRGYRTLNIYGNYTIGYYFAPIFVGPNHSRKDLI